MGRWTRFLLFSLHGIGASSVSAVEVQLWSCLLPTKLVDDRWPASRITVGGSPLQSSVPCEWQTGRQPCQCVMECWIDIYDDDDTENDAVTNDHRDDDGE